MFFPPKVTKKSPPNIRIMVGVGVPVNDIGLTLTLNTLTFTLKWVSRVKHPNGHTKVISETNLAAGSRVTLKYA